MQTLNVFFYRISRVGVFTVRTKLSNQKTLLSKLASAASPYSTASGYSPFAFGITNANRYQRQNQ